MAKQTPSQKVLERFFNDYAADGYPESSLDDVWEIFVADLLLKEKLIDDEEIRSGIVDGSQDGGIDAFYTFLNGTLVQEDHPALESEKAASKSVGDAPVIEVLISQAKNKSAWQETSVEKLLSSLPLLFESSRSEEHLRTRYREALVSQVMIFRSLSENLAVKFPKFILRITYATRAPESAITQTLKDKALQLKTAAAALLTPGALVSCELIGADTLYQLAGKTYSAPSELRFRNALIREDGSYLGIATLADYLMFVRDDSGALRTEMFESNVRDFEGSNQVNSSIQATLAKPSGAEFWWQNNGVTVLARRVNAPNQTLTIEQPLIVNGLQTTHVLHQADKENDIHASRATEGILVRVIESDDEDVRDQVIAGTNRQTKVDGAALYATDPLQIDIERYFLANDWFYERRKNHYRNLKKPAARRVSISLLGQAAMTLVMGEPDAARGRPTTVLGKSYEKVFNSDLGVNGYLRAAQLLSTVSSFLRTSDAKDIVNDYSNMRFYLLIGAAMQHQKAKSFTELRFVDNHAKLPSSFQRDELIRALKRVEELFNKYHVEHPKLTIDSIAKNADFRRWFMSEFSSQN